MPTCSNLVTTFFSTSPGFAFFGESTLKYFVSSRFYSFDDAAPLFQS